jgi:hypothetical protein
VGAGQGQGQGGAGSSSSGASASADNNSDYKKYPDYGFEDQGGYADGKRGDDRGMYNPDGTLRDDVQAEGKDGVEGRNGFGGDLKGPGGGGGDQKQGDTSWADKGRGLGGADSSAPSNYLAGTSILAYFTEELM